MLSLTSDEEVKMRDGEYRPEQIPSYGTHEQLALAERTRGVLRRTQLGTGLAVLAVLLAVVALLTFPTNLFGQPDGRGWAVAVLVCSVLLLGVCAFQHFSWLRAGAAWRGERDTDVRQLATLSTAAEVLAYAVTVGAAAACIAGAVYAGCFATASVLLLVTVLLMLAALVLAGVENVRSSGPPGTVPAHMRRLVERDNVRRTG